MNRTTASLLRKSLITIFLVLMVDQVLKFSIKTTMILGEEIPVFGNWFILHFTENRGMAFGMEFGGESGKLILSLFRIVAVGFIAWYLYTLIKKQAGSGLIICISLVFAGALGNIIDSAFYGMLFSDSFFHPARFLPPERGYDTFLHGKVVDMFYFPIIQTTLPSWLPFWGGREFLFFRPVFNIADSSISVGVILLIIFQRKFFAKPEEKKTESQAEDLLAAESKV
ncbi:MAG TPA: lipoprotein signal peptidase [Bacteroidales bacterium]|nr:lipoprotein signal peptidase [Bacteroidales bacterium]HSA44592.1 lipoprotein signal peptidase [Bacteroidales bacterium]